MSTADQIQQIEQKIISEKQKSKERISKLIDKVKDTEDLIALVDGERAATAKKIEQLNNQKRSIETREQVRKRKERTRRLIQHGALAEKYFNCGDIATVDFENILKAIVARVHVNEILYEMKTGQQKKE